MHENYVQQLKKGALEMVLLSILAEGHANCGFLHLNRRALPLFARV